MLDAEGNADLYKEEPLNKKLLRNGFRLYFFAFIAAPAGYIIKVLASHNLSVEDIGLFYSIFGVVSIISAYNDLGLTEALQYYLPHYLIDKEYGKAKSILVFTFLVQLISGIIIGGFLFFGAGRLTTHYFKSPVAEDILRIFSLYFIIINFLQVLQSVFIASQYIKYSQGSETLRIWSTLGCMAIGAYFHVFSVTRFTYFWLIGISITTLVCIIWAYKKFLRLMKYPFVYDAPLFKKQWKYAFRIILATNSTTILSQVDQQMAFYFFGSAKAGYRSNYLSLLNIIHVISAPIIAYLFPLLNELYKKNEHEKIRILHRYLYLGSFFFGGIIGLVCYIWGPDISVLFFGENYRESGLLLRAAAPFMFLIPLVGIGFQNLASRGRSKERVLILFLGILSTLLGSLLFIHRFELKGIVYGTICGYIVMVLLSFYQQRTKNLQ